MENCKTCAHAVFNETWGEYRCDKTKAPVNPDRRINCASYKKANDKEKKE